MIKTLKEIIFSKKFRHEDPDVGLIKRVGGYWRIETPIKTLDVSVKITGSDRFGPNKYALSAYKKYRGSIERLWVEVQEKMKEEFLSQKQDWNIENTNFQLSEILVDNPKNSNADIVFAFMIEQDHYAIYSALTLNGKYNGYECVRYK